MATAPSPSAPSRTGTLVVAALVVVLAWQLAHWTWVFLSPPPLASVAPADGPADLAVAARLFGGTVGGTSTTAAASTSGLRLKGVVAPTPGTAASAIFNKGSGKDVSVYIGNEVTPGVKLVEVLPDAAIVSRSGVRERIELDVRKATATLPRGSRAAAAAPQFRLSVASSGNSFAISRKELDETLKDPQQFNYLGRIATNPSGGGVRMEAAPPGSLPAKLGLQPGDIIRKVNGQTVLSPADLALLYQKFGTVSTVQAEVLRGSSTVFLSYSINP
jgi:general secretion pathway protein C